MSRQTLVIQNLAILSKSGRKRLDSPREVGRANDLLLTAALGLAPISVGAEWMRCVQCHLSSGPFAANHAVARHSHSELQIEIGIEGEFEFCTDGGEVFSLRPGEALVVASQTAHAWRTRSGGCLVGILLRESSGVDNCLREQAQSGAVIVSTDSLRIAVTGLCRDLLDDSGGPLAAHVVGGWLALVIANALRTFVVEPRRPAFESRFSRRCEHAVDLACSYVGANIHRAMTLNEIAREVGLSVRHLRRAFQAEKSMTLHDYIMRQRLTRAVEIMESSPGFQMKAIAVDCGFSSPSHFSSAFRKNFGVAPGEYYKRKR